MDIAWKEVTVQGVEPEVVLMIRVFLPDFVQDDKKLDWVP